MHPIKCNPFKPLVVPSRREDQCAVNTSYHDCCHPLLKTGTYSKRCHLYILVTHCPQHSAILEKHKSSVVCIVIPCFHCHHISMRMWKCELTQWTNHEACCPGCCVIVFWRRCTQASE